VGLDVKTVSEGLNPVLRGWANYFRRGNSAKKFGHVDHYVYRRLARFASIKPRSTDEVNPGEAAYPCERPPELGR
jgi:hypothetical protein